MMEELTDEKILLADNRCATVDEIVAKFGDNVTRLREARGMKGKELAARLGIAASVVSAWEKGRRGLPETPTLLRLAKALNVSVEELLRGVDEDYDVQVEAVKHDVLRRLAEARGRLQKGGFDAKQVIRDMDDAERERLLLLLMELSILQDERRGVGVESTTEIRDPTPHLTTLENKRVGVTRSDIPSGVQDHLSVTRGETAHAAAEGTAAAGYADRLSESEDVEMRVREDILSRFHRKQLAERLFAAADEIRAVATALHAGPSAPKSGAKESASARGRAGVRQGHARRGKRA